MSKVKKWIIFAVAFVVAVLLVVFIAVNSSKDYAKLSIQASQVQDSQKILVNWETSKTVDSVTISVYHNGDFLKSETLSQYTGAMDGVREIDAMYGNVTVKVKVKRGNATTTKKTTVGLTADEYNFAPITATMPVTLFTLNLDEITENGTIPTFVWFKRSDAWDWNKLPEGVYKMPVAGNQFLNSNEVVMYRETSDYIEELYKLNPDSHFNLYYNDFFADGWVDATIANGIPAENYNVVLLSDGTASFSYFNEHFNNENADANYETMKQEWNTLKTQVASYGEYRRTSKKKFNISTNALREYAYVMATEEDNVEWWLTRINGTLAPQNQEFYAKVEANQSVVVSPFADILKAMTNEERAELKALYKFNDSMFEKAETENKKVMMILGTWTEDEHHFEEYVNAIQDYYGDEYIYYYKGHPKNPTDTVEGKLEYLESLSLIDVDSTIPAELILFFKPEIYLTGYNTSTYQSLEDDDQCCGLWDLSLSEAQEIADMENYRDKMEFYITKVEDDDLTYGDLVNNDKSLLLEFTDTTNYDIAIYNGQNSIFTYYKYNSTNSTYEVVTNQ